MYWQLHVHIYICKYNVIYVSNGRNHGFEAKLVHYYYVAVWVSTADASIVALVAVFVLFTDRSLNFKS